MLFVVLFLFVFFGCTSITIIGRESGVWRSKEGGGKEAGGGGGERGLRRDEEGRGRSSVASIVEVVIGVRIFSTGRQSWKRYSIIWKTASRGTSQHGL